MTKVELREIVRETMLKKLEEFKVDIAELTSQTTSRQIDELLDAVVEVIVTRGRS